MLERSDTRAPEFLRHPVTPPPRCTEEPRVGSRAHACLRHLSTPRGPPYCPPPAPAGLASAQISLEPDSSSQPPPSAREMAPRSWKVTGAAVPSSHVGGCPILSGPLCKWPPSRTNPSSHRRPVGLLPRGTGATHQRGLLPQQHLHPETPSPGEARAALPQRSDCTDTRA